MEVQEAEHITGLLSAVCGVSDSGVVRARPGRGRYQGLGAYVQPSVDVVKGCGVGAVQQLSWRKEGFKLVILRATNEWAGRHFARLSHPCGREP